MTASFKILPMKTKRNRGRGTKGEKLSTTFERVEDQAIAIDKARDRLNRVTSECVFSMGQNLREAQERLAKNGDGTFVKWCNQRLKLGKTTAYK